MSHRFLTASTVAALSAVPALAGVSYTSQTRTLTVEAFSGPPASDSRSAPNFGVWNEFVECVSPPGEPGQGESSASASQNSSLSATGILASGTCHAVDGYLGGGAGGGVGISTVDVTFDITGGPAEWRFMATGITGQASVLTVKFERISPSPAILYQNNGFTQSPPWSASGPLTDGTYRVNFSAKAANPGIGTGSVTQAYTMALMVPAPGAAAVLGMGVLFAGRRRRS